MASSVNTISSAGSVRQPRGIVKVNDTPMPGWIDWEVNNNNHYHADTFRVVFALSMLPAQFGAEWWSAQTSVQIEILAGFPADPDRFADTDLKSWIYGDVDEVDLDPLNGLLTIMGRDLTARLIDTKTTENWQNKTSSEIAKLLAERHSLGTSKVSKTDQKAGSIYEIDQVQMNQQRSEWDLLTYLASREGFVVFVRGKDLHFEERPDTDEATPYLLKVERPDGSPQRFNGKTLQLTRSLTVARGITVLVRSWNAKSKRAFTATFPKEAKTIAPGTAAPRGSTQAYVFVKPGLTQQQADELAMNKHRELTRHEMKLMTTLPADDLLTVDSVIKIDGTASKFDQVYFPDTVVRRMSLGEGYAMTVSAKNHSTDTETLA